MQTSERLASGEITQDEFLVVVHQIRQLFQYQEGKHRCNVRDSPKEENKGGLKKKPLLSDAELTYYEHKAKYTLSYQHTDTYTLSYEQEAIYTLS